MGVQKFMKNFFLRGGWCFFLVFALVSCCAIVDYLPPRQGTSAELQSVLAKSLEENMKEVLFDPAGKVVDIHVQAIGGFETSRGLEKYVQSMFQEWVVKKGGKIGPEEFRMDVYLPVLGSTATSREFSYQYIPLYYSERFRTTNQMMVMVRDGEGKLVGTWKAGQVGDWSDVFLMRMFNP